MKQPLVPAYVIHRRRYGDSNLLVELFTQSEGRIAVMARGAASSRSGRKGLLQPFIPLLASWTGKGEIKSLCKLENVSQSVMLTGRRLYCGLYVNELIMRLTQRHDAAPSLFRLYETTLSSLVSEEDMELVLRRFELELLLQLGYALELTRDASSGIRVDPHQYYVYHEEKGLELSRKGVSKAIKGTTLLALSESDSKLDQLQKAEAKKLMRQVLRFYLGEKPIKSRELFQTK